MSLMADVIYGDAGFAMSEIVRSALIKDRDEDRFGFGREYYDKYLQKMDAIKNSNQVRRAKSIIRRTKEYFNSNNVFAFYKLGTISKMQNPNPIMFDYIMANPRLRQLRKDNIINGYRDDYAIPYDESYKDSQIKYYRHVVSGMLQRDEEDKLYSIQYFETSDSRSILSTSDQFNCFNNWKLILDSIDEGGDDPTSKYNDAL